MFILHSSLIGVKLQHRFEIEFKNGVAFGAHFRAIFDCDETPALAPDGLKHTGIKAFSFLVGHEYDFSDPYITNVTKEVSTTSDCETETVYHFELQFDVADRWLLGFKFGDFGGAGAYTRKSRTFRSVHSSPPICCDDSKSTPDVASGAKPRAKWKRSMRRKAKGGHANMRSSAVISSVSLMLAISALLWLAPAIIDFFPTNALLDGGGDLKSILSSISSTLAEFPFAKVAFGCATLFLATSSAFLLLRTLQFRKIELGDELESK